MRTLLALLLAAAALPQAPAGPDLPSLLSLVETAPIETSLDDPALPEAAEVWLEMIGAAERSIELAHFYASVKEGEGGRLAPVVAALEAAAARGVAVRFLADAGFHETYPETLDRLGAHEGIELRLYDLRARTGGVLHAKYMLVDGREVFLGSQNFDWRSLEHILELGLRVRQPEVAAAFGEVFALDWALAAGEEPPRRRRGAPSAGTFPVEVALAGGGTALVTPVASPKGLLPDEELWDLPRLVAWIDAAREEVTVQLLSYRTGSREEPYWDALEAALRRAAGRGASVKLLLADWSQRAGSIEGLKSLQSLRNVEVRLVTIPQWSGGFVPFARVAHAKAMTVDGRRAWVGTSNWSRDYFHASRNVGLLVEGAEFTRTLRAFFERTWASDYAETVDPCREYEAPRVGE